MTVKLPEPLPYEYVDELIDETLVFQSYEYVDADGNDMVDYSARRRDGRWAGNVSRMMVGVIDDDYDFWEEDEEGYVDGTELRSGFRWTARELTDDEIELILDDMD